MMPELRVNVSCIEHETQHCPRSKHQSEVFVFQFISVSAVWVKKSPYGFLKLFPKRLGIFNQFSTHLLYDHFYTRVQIEGPEGVDTSCIDHFCHPNCSDVLPPCVRRSIYLFIHEPQQQQMTLLFYCLVSLDCCNFICVLTDVPIKTMNEWNDLTSVAPPQ